MSFRPSINISLPNDCVHLRAGCKESDVSKNRHAGLLSATLCWPASPSLRDGPALSITFGPIVGSAEHLAVLGRAFAAFAPRGNVVGVHFAISRCTGRRNPHHFDFEATAHRLSVFLQSLLYAVYESGVYAIRQ